MNAGLDTPLALRTSLRWDNGFERLGPEFFTPVQPQPLPAPYWVAHSPEVASALGLDESWPNDDWLHALSGHLAIDGTRPLASVYSGHQFGQWAGQLGDGRALWLGETAGLEVQLKGSGRTPYSRMGDGRAVLRSSIREFLCSEAMAGLGIPTTRALCVIGSDLPVRRERLETAAVVTRVAPSFVRFGHFEHFAARAQWPALQRLADYVIDRYYPQCRAHSAVHDNPYTALLQEVTERTATLIAHWQAVGFCHGVMNTDNMSILGLTLDYGPFGFLDAYDPGHICNHSDHSGRYAFSAQPAVAHWNLYALAQALLPLMPSQAVALQVLDTFMPLFTAEWHHLMTAKLGLPSSAESDARLAPLLDDLLRLLARDRVDYTLFWWRLGELRTHPDAAPVHDLFLDQAALEAWLTRYSELLTAYAPATDATRLHNPNPRYVLRNHLCQNAIESAQDKDFSGVHDLLVVMRRPFDAHPEHAAMASFPPAWASQIEISCSS